jgi:hypothetical protein
MGNGWNMLQILNIKNNKLLLSCHTLDRRLLALTSPTTDFGGVLLAVNVLIMLGEASGNQGKRNFPRGLTVVPVPAQL